MGLINKQLKFFKVNQAACDLLGYRMTELIDQDLLSLTHKSEQQQGISLFNELVSGVRQQLQVRTRYIKKDGNDIWVQTTLSAVYDLDGKFEYAVVHAQDINQEYHLNQQLIFLAQNDTLTKLPNRYAFEKQMQSLLEEQNDTEHVLCYIDLDQFKVINDTCGHAAGDELLQQVSKVLKQGLRKSDFLSRIGGDEFAVLMFGCSIKSAILQLEKLLTTLREYHFDYENHR